MAQTTPATAPATSLPWAWRLFRAADSDDERFLIAFLHAQSHTGLELRRGRQDRRRGACVRLAIRGLTGQFHKCFGAAPGYVRRRKRRLEPIDHSGDIGNSFRTKDRLHAGPPFRFAMSPSTWALGLMVRSNVSRLTLTSPNLGR